MRCDGDDKNRAQTTNDVRDDVTDSQAHGWCGALVARISYLSQDQPDLKFASMQVCCAIAKPSVSAMGRVTRIGRYLVAKPRAEHLFHNRVVSWKRAWTPIGEVTNPPDGQCQLE